MSDLALESVAAAIAAKGAKWNPRAQAVSRRGFDMPKRRVVRSLTRSPALPFADAPPIDWRDKARLTPPEDQGDDVTCVSFAVCGAMQDRHAIDRPNDRPINLAPGYLHTCIGGISEKEPYDIEDALKALQNRAVPEGGPGDYPRKKACDLAPPGGYKIQGFRPLASDAEAKSALQQGPVVAVLELWKDLADWYGGGVFKHVSGPSYGAHAVEVVGWRQSPDCWIVKNSFGTNWGDKGFALIEIGECGMFADFYGYALEGVGPVAFV